MPKHNSSTNLPPLRHDIFKNHVEKWESTMVEPSDSGELVSQIQGVTTTQPEEGKNLRREDTVSLYVPSILASPMKFTINVPTNPDRSYETRRLHSDQKRVVSKTSTKKTQSHHKKNQNISSSQEDTVPHVMSPSVNNAVLVKVLSQLLIFHRNRKSALRAELMLTNQYEARQDQLREEQGLPTRFSRKLQQRKMKEVLSNSEVVEETATKAGEDTINLAESLAPLKPLTKKARLQTIPDPDFVPILVARNFLRSHRKHNEEWIKVHVQSLDIWKMWGSHIEGMGEISIGQLIAEAKGDLWKFPTVAKLWTRMGVGLCPDGTIQRKIKVTGDTEEENDAKRELAERMKYKPARRALVYMVGELLIKRNYIKKGEKEHPEDDVNGVYREIYLKRKVYEIEKSPQLKLIHQHRRAKRYMEKQFLKHFWQAWRKVYPAPIWVVDPLPSEQQMS